MKKTRIGSLDVILAGGSDREGGGDGPVVILLHGFGAPGEDLVGLWRVMDVPQGTRFVFPAALLSLAAEGYPAGRAWWRIDMAAIQRGDPRLTTEVPVGLDAARAAVLAVVDHVENDWKVPASKIVLGGFSQGAMLATDVALRRNVPGSAFAGVAVLSGTLIAAAQWTALLETMPKPPPPFFQSHGIADPILPFPLAELFRDTLRKAGVDVSWSPFRGGHEIPPTVLEELGRFLTRVLA